MKRLHPPLVRPPEGGLGPFVALVVGGVRCSAPYGSRAEARPTGVFEG
jgi:hypothetical protein